MMYAHVHAKIGIWHGVIQHFFIWGKVTILLQAPDFFQFLKIFRRGGCIEKFSYRTSS